MRWYNDMPRSREGLPLNIETAFKKYGEHPGEGSGLPQSEVAGNEKHDHNNTYYVENIAHVSFSFLSRERICRSSLYSEETTPGAALVVPRSMRLKGILSSEKSAFWVLGGT